MRDSQPTTQLEKKHGAVNATSALLALRLRRPPRSQEKPGDVFARQLFLSPLRRTCSLPLLRLLVALRRPFFYLSLRVLEIT